jgi:hypothetical protein
MTGRYGILCVGADRCVRQCFTIFGCPYIGLRVVSISGLHQDAHGEYVSTTEASNLGVGGFRPLMDTTLRSMRFFEDVVAKKMACLSTETV